MTESEPTRTFRTVEPGSPIVTYRLEDYAKIFSLYAKVAEHALRASTGHGSVRADDKRRG